MKNAPLVSIGVPVYNGDTYLNECLDSILTQTYQNWECIIVNNQSTDKTLDIAESYSKRDERFKVITNDEFVDMITNFNNAYKYASKEAKYFKVVCADDWIFPEFIEKMAGIMEQNTNVGICSSYRIDNTEVRCDHLNYKDGPVFDGKKILLQQLKNLINVTGSETTVLWRVNALKKLQSYPILFSENKYHFDTQLAHELLSYSDLGFVFQVLSYTRRHPGTFTSQIVNRFQTPTNLREGDIFKYRNLFPELKKEYKKVRTDYGFFLLKKHLSRDKECLEWHDKHLDSNRKFTLAEFLIIIPTVFINKVLYKVRRKKNDEL